MDAHSLNDNFQFGVRWKLLLWLGIVLVPVAIAALASVRVIDSRLTDQIEEDLVNTLRLEAIRIQDELDDARMIARSLTMGTHIRLFVSGIHRYRTGQLADGVAIGGFDDYPVIDPKEKYPLNILAAVLKSQSVSAGSEIVELRILDVGGNTLGQTAGFSWEPYNKNIFNLTVNTEKVVFGNAFRVSENDDRLGIVAPVFDYSQQVVGTLVVETRLGPIVDLVEAHEGFGETSESHIAQPTLEGDAEFITLLRFRREAAFNKIVPKSKDLPINWSLESPGGRLVRSPDYRSVDSILAIETLPETGWGLVVKIDAAEAFQPIVEVKRIVSIASMFVAGFILIGWYVFLHPIGTRLEKSAKAAERIANDDLNQPISDCTKDEIGNVSRAIDKLARDLLVDKERRNKAEEKLLYQATHDELTGLYNRKHGNALIREVDESLRYQYSSILFLDLDGFKRINDTHGHAAGDEILKTVSKNLESVLNDSTVLIRWGGDEFVVVLPGKTKSDALAVVAAIKEIFDKPLETKHGVHAVGCSIGTSTTGRNGTLLDVLQEADAQMYKQKNLIQRSNRQVSAAERTVQTALGDNRVEVWFQPIVKNINNEIEIVGAEALARIRREDGAVIPAGSFVPDIAGMPLSGELDQHVHARALKSLSRWRATGEINDDFFVSLNVGNYLISEGLLFDGLRSHLVKCDLPAESVSIEISRRISKLNLDELSKIRDSGMRIVLSNMGLSHSNLDRLLEIQPDMVRLDQHWMHDLPKAEGHQAGAILPRLLDICYDLDIAVMIDGVETQEQFMMLSELKVSQMQGLYFAAASAPGSFITEWGKNDRRAA